MKRYKYLDDIETSWATFPIVALLGPRQVGKTTLAREYAEGTYKGSIPATHYFDLDDPTALARLSNPKMTLGGLEGLIVIDEIQRLPELFPVLRVLVDEKQNKRRFLVLGSASLDLVKSSSESLAGRIRYIEVHPFNLHEVGATPLENLWLRGGFPRSFLAPDNAASFLWLDQYIRAYLERDIPQLGFNIPALAMRRFWMMLTHYHGQMINQSEIARSLDISDATVRRYLDILAGTFMVRRLQPWFENIGKRQVKTPKIYFRDSGILHFLLGIRSREELLVNPRLGASWEGFALEEVVRVLGLREEECFFWAVHQQAELDLLTFQDGKRIGYEFKYTERPQVTTSMSTAFKVLRLDELCVVYPGEIPFPLESGIRAVGLKSFAA